MNQVRKQYRINSLYRKVWDILKNLLYLLSLAIMIFWGYEKANDSGSVNKKIVDPVQQEISGENQNNDSIYYAFTHFINEYSRSRN